MYCRSRGEELIKYQANSSCVIMSVILMTTLFYKTLILREEIWCWKGELRRNCSPIGTIIQTLFVPNQEPASAWIFGNSSVRVGTQGLFCPYLKTFVPPFLPTRLTAPGSPRMGGIRLSETTFGAFWRRYDKVVKSETWIFPKIFKLQNWLFLAKWLATLCLYLKKKWNVTI